MMQVQKILSLLSENGLLRTPVPDCAGLQIDSVGCDSRAVTKGQLFFVKGANFKPEFLRDAERAGAVCAIAQTAVKTALPLVLVSDVRRAMPLVANAFYGNPSAKYHLTGVTGTKGKTTCAYMLKSIFDAQFGAAHTGLISTTEALCGGVPIEKHGTTPEALELYGILNRFAAAGVRAACMEVSSQGLQYNRVDGVDFDTGVFLNLGSDHISPTEHRSFEEYKAAKLRLFSLCRRAVVNLDDPHGAEFLKAARCPVYTVSIDKDADFCAKNVLLSKKGCSFELSGTQLNGTVIELRMPGEFNITNALCAAAAAHAAGCGAEQIRQGLLQTVVAGRMQLYEQNGVTVVVDYAHNELSFEAVFRYLETFYPAARIICLFACQGNKALDRRVELPRVVGRHADFAVITSDDPENEDPERILEQVAAEFKKTGVPFAAIPDREQAVTYAIRHARRGDVVFLAGKGQETTQKVHGGTVFYKGDLPSAIDAFR